MRFQLDNHLGSASLEMDESGLVIGYEEYHPYGTTAYWSKASSSEVSLRRYRYIGKEKDEETGLYYHGARHCAPWLGRWTSADPAGMVDGPNLYEYVRGNPVRSKDPSGRWKEPVVIPPLAPITPQPPSPPAPKTEIPRKIEEEKPKNTDKKAADPVSELLAHAESKDFDAKVVAGKNLTPEQAAFIVRAFLITTQELAKRNLPTESAVLVVAHTGNETSFAKPGKDNPNAAAVNVFGYQP